MHASSSFISLVCAIDVYKARLPLDLPLDPLYLHSAVFLKDQDDKSHWVADFVPQYARRPSTLFAMVGGRCVPGNVRLKKVRLWPKARLCTYLGSTQRYVCLYFLPVSLKLLLYPNLPLIVCVILHFQPLCCVSEQSRKLHSSTATTTPKCPSFETTAKPTSAH